MAVMGAFYFLMGTGILWLTIIKLKKRETGWVRVVLLPFLPIIFVWGIIFAVLSFPYWWLYPERHVTAVDVNGSEEEKRMLKEYREACGQRGFLRRLSERLGIFPNADPPCPFSTGRLNETIRGDS